MRLWIIFLAATLTLVQLFGCRTAYAAGGVDTSKDLVIRFGNQPGVNLASIVKHYRWLEKQGYKVTWISFNDAGSEMRALAAGELDVMVAGAAPEMILASRYAGAWFVAAPVTNGNQLMVPVKSPIKSVQDLRGKRIAYPGPASQQFALISAALQSTDMKLSEVNLYKSAGPDMLALMERGEIDGFMGWTPFTSEAARTGVGRVLLNAQDVFEKAGGKGKWISAGYIASKKFAQEHPQALTDVMKEIARALRLFRTQPDEAIAALSEETGLSKETIGYTISHKFLLLSDTIVPDRENVLSMVTIFAKADLIKGVQIPSFVEELVHPEYAQKAEAELDREALKR